MQLSQWRCVEPGTTTIARRILRVRLSSGARPPSCPLVLDLRSINQSPLRADFNSALDAAEASFEENQLPHVYRQGLGQTFWPGRSQIVQADQDLNPVHSTRGDASGKVTFFLDGAHTQESMAVCAGWFADTCRQAGLLLPLIPCAKVGCVNVVACPSAFAIGRCGGRRESYSSLVRV